MPFLGHSYRKPILAGHMLMAAGYTMKRQAPQKRLGIAIIPEMEGGLGFKKIAPSDLLENGPNCGE